MRIRKLPLFLPFPSLESRGAARGHRQWPSPAAWASGAVGRRGERGREVRGFDPPLDFGKDGPWGGVQMAMAEAAGGGHGQRGQGRSGACAWEEK